MGLQVEGRRWRKEEVQGGIDFNEIFSPIVKMTSIRTILSLVAVEDLHLEQLDVKASFLHGYLEEEIYMQHHRGMRSKGRIIWFAG